ncbi:MAG TPA: PAS domain-containing protein, partial [Thermoanaerobaculia bacterium]
MAGQPMQAASPGAGRGAENGDDTIPSRVAAARELASAALSDGEPPALLLRDHSPALEFLKDETGRLVYYNRAFANIFATDGASLLRKKDHEWLPPASAECVRRHDETVLATGAVLEIEETLPTPAGPRHWLVLRFPLQADSGVRLVGAVAVDISDRRRRESTLHRMAAILESSHDAVISASPDGYVTSWNTGATQMYGYTAAEMEGRPVSILEPEDRAGEIDQVLERVRAGERVVRYETMRLHKNGRALEVAVSVSPILDETGEIAG